MIYDQKVKKFLNIRNYFFHSCCPVKNFMLSIFVKKRTWNFQFSLIYLQNASFVPNNIYFFWHHSLNFLLKKLGKQDEAIIFNGFAVLKGPHSFQKKTTRNLRMIYFQHQISKNCRPKTLFSYQFPPKPTLKPLNFQTKKLNRTSTQTFRPRPTSPSVPRRRLSTPSLPRQRCPFSRETKTERDTRTRPLPTAQFANDRGENRKPHRVSIVVALFGWYVEPGAREARQLGRPCIIWGGVVHLPRKSDRRGRKRGKAPFKRERRFF